MTGMLFFWLGLGAVAFFFAGVTLLLLSLFAASPAGQRRLTQVQSVSLLAVLILAAASVVWILPRLAPFAGADAPTAASAVDGAMRDLLSVVLIGLSLTMNALLAAFSWVRLGAAGNAFRALVWSWPALRLVLAGNELLDAFDLRRGPDGGLAQPEAQAAAFRAALDAATGEVRQAALLAAGLFLLSLLLSLFWSRGRGASSAAA